MSREPRNQWKELDEFPELGKYHVRHSIPAARGTGYLFGKNFDTLSEAVQFFETQEYTRLLIHVDGEHWLKIEAPLAYIHALGSNR